MVDRPLGLVQGTLDLLILRTLAWEPTHGYGISQWIRRQTNGVLEIRDAALYQALRRLEGKGLIEADWGVSENNRRARFYTLTERGRRQLAEEETVWKEYTDAVFKVLRPDAG